MNLRISHDNKAIILVALVLASFHIFVRRPSTPDLNARCQPSRRVNIARERFQRNRYWTAQLTALDREIGRIQRLPVQRRRIDSMIAQNQGRFDSVRRRHEFFMDSVYAAHPGVPRPEQNAAEVLRDSAREIEDRNRERIVDSVLRERLTRLLQCRPQVVQRTAK
jgi:hypothetical protein